MIKNHLKHFFCLALIATGVIYISCNYYIPPAFEKTPVNPTPVSESVVQISGGITQNVESKSDGTNLFLLIETLDMMTANKNVTLHIKSPDKDWSSKLVKEDTIIKSAYDLDGEGKATVFYRTNSSDVINVAEYDSESGEITEFSFSGFPTDCSLQKAKYIGNSRYLLGIISGSSMDIFLIDGAARTSVSIFDPYTVLSVATKIYDFGLTATGAYYILFSESTSFYHMIAYYSTYSKIRLFVGNVDSAVLHPSADERTQYIYVNENPGSGNTVRIFSSSDGSNWGEILNYPTGKNPNLCLFEDNRYKYIFALPNEYANPNWTRMRMVQYLDRPDDADVKQDLNLKPVYDPNVDRSMNVHKIRLDSQKTGFVSVVRNSSTSPHIRFSFYEYLSADQENSK